MFYFSRCQYINEAGGTSTFQSGPSNRPRRSPHSSGLHKQMHQQRRRGRMLGDVLWLLHQSEDHSDHPPDPCAAVNAPVCAVRLTHGR